ncbi:zinc ribbon domain-containing protein [Streptomyces sp. 6N223]|uniref:zinc ribbon domain-containing protein n=1 Tax=Streptomyces sp. 6N223 TaxID=3457412 RepID=UPI003FD2A2D4
MGPRQNPAYTSQTCGRSGVVDTNSPESQAKATFACTACTACGRTEHADVNAARVIKAAGLAVSACGDFAAARSAQQEPVGRATGRTRARRAALPLGIPRLRPGRTPTGRKVPLQARYGGESTGYG